MGYVDALAARLSWEEVVANFTFFSGSSRDYSTARPTADFMMQYIGDDVCQWPNNDRNDRIHPMAAMVVE